jgi:uncharacterized protein (DUF305 family)
MTTLKKLVTGAALTLALGTAAVAQSHDQHQSTMNDASMQKMMQEIMPKPNDPASTKDFKEVDMKMMRAMDKPFTGMPDVDFVRGMIPHHQGAIDMAKVQLKHGKDPELRKMAERIIADQEREIAEMQTWLKKNQK